MFFQLPKLKLPNVDGTFLEEISGRIPLVEPLISNGNGIEGLVSRGRGKISGNCCKFLDHLWEGL